MKQKAIYITCFAALWAFSCIGQSSNITASLELVGTNSYTYLEKHDLDAGNARGYATLSVEPLITQTRDSLSIEVRFFNNGQRRDFWNPFFDPAIRPPAILALYDASHNYIGDLLQFHSGSAKLSSDDAFTLIPSGGSVGKEFQVKLFYPGKQLPPGDYYLQVIYSKSFIALDPPWADTPPDFTSQRTRMSNFLSHFDSSELFRSNPVKITITK